VSPEASTARPVLVTGANGFLGSFLCRELAAPGYDVHGTVRASSDRANLAGVDVTLHQADVRDPDAVRAAVEAFAAAGPEPWLVHNAAVISYRPTDGPLQEAVNHQGTRHVLDAARAAGVARVLHVSSVVTLGVARRGETLHEDSPWNAEALDVEYVRTKRRAEEAALAAADELDLRVVNPGAIFGPVSSSSNSLRFLRQLAEGRIGRVTPPGGMSVVGVEDTATGARLALERGRAGRRYVLVERHLSSYELFALAKRLLRGADARPPWFAVPRWAWALLVPFARLVERGNPDTLLSSRTVRMLGRSFRCTGARARMELGWEPRPFPDVLAETIATLRANGSLPPMP
jgi:dihydroflavonol-4-reductase